MRKALCSIISMALLAQGCAERTNQFIPQASTLTQQERQTKDRTKNNQEEQGEETKKPEGTKKEEGSRPYQYKGLEDTKHSISETNSLCRIYEKPLKHIIPLDYIPLDKFNKLFPNELFESKNKIQKYEYFRGSEYDNDFSDKQIIISEITNIPYKHRNIIKTETPTEPLTPPTRSPKPTAYETITASAGGKASASPSAFYSASGTLSAAESATPMTASETMTVNAEEKASADSSFFYSPYGTPLILEIPSSASESKFKTPSKTKPPSATKTPIPTAAGSETPIQLGVTDVYSAINLVDSLTTTGRPTITPEPKPESGRKIKKLIVYSARGIIVITAGIGGAFIVKEYKDFKDFEKNDKDGAKGLRQKKWGRLKDLFDKLRGKNDFSSEFIRNLKFLKKKYIRPCEGLFLYEELGHQTFLMWLLEKYEGFSLADFIRRRLYTNQIDRLSVGQEEDNLPPFRIRIPQRQLLNRLRDNHHYRIYNTMTGETVIQTMRQLLTAYNFCLFAETPTRTVTQTIRQLFADPVVNFRETEPITFSEIVKRLITSIKIKYRLLIYDIIQPPEGTDTFTTLFRDVQARVDAPARTLEYLFRNNINPYEDTERYLEVQPEVRVEGEAPAVREAAPAEVRPLNYLIEDHYYEILDVLTLRTHIYTIQELFDAYGVRYGINYQIGTDNITPNIITLQARFRFFETQQPVDENRHIIDMRTVFEHQGTLNRQSLRQWLNYGINPIRNNQYRRIGIPATIQMLENLIPLDQRDAKEINPQDIDFTNRSQYFRIEDGINYYLIGAIQLGFLEYYIDTTEANPFYLRGINNERAIKRSEVNTREFLKKFKVYKTDPPADEE